MLWVPSLMAIRDARLSFPEVVAWNSAIIACEAGAGALGKFGDLCKGTKGFFKKH